jgi:hypothetical protein
MNKAANSMPAYPRGIADLLVSSYLEKHQKRQLRAAKAKKPPAGSGCPS